MAVVIVDTFSRGSTGDSPFPIVKQEDIKIAYLTVANIIERDAIEEWKRTAGLRVHVLADGKDYRLGSDVTIAGQVWTEVQSSAAFQLLAEKNSPGGYVGLELDGFINPAYIKSIYANSSYIVTTVAERNALTTVTGDIIVVTGTSETYVKLNNNPSPTIDDDFSLLSVAATVLSVNGQVGSVVIDFNSIITQGGSQASFESAVAATPSVSGNTSQTANNTNDIVNIYSILSGLGVATETAIPLYNSGDTYEDGFNVVYGSVNNRNLYRVKEGQGPVTSILPTDITKWEKIGDFYTKDEIDALLLNLVSEPDFNWNRPITRIPQVGEVPAGNKLIQGIEEIYYGRVDTTVELLSIDALQIGETIAPTINGRITKNDANNIQSITILDSTNTPVGSPVFSGGDDVIEFSFQVDTPILIEENSTLGYKIKVEVIYDVLLSVETIITTEVLITPVHPILFGVGVAGLDAITKYTSLTKIIEVDGNKKLFASPTDNKVYFCIPEGYGDRISIIGDTNVEVLGSLFPDLPVIEQVTSTGLTVNWTKNYKVYQTNYNISGINLKFDFKITLLGSSTGTLDDIAEGNINKHLTVSLRDKLLNFNGSDYLTKATYDINNDGIVEKAFQQAIIGVNNTTSFIPIFTLVTFHNLNTANNQVEIEIANKDTPIAARAMTIEDFTASGGTGVIVTNGIVTPIDTSTRQINDIVYLDSAGSFAYDEPVSGIVQPIGRVLTVGVNGAVYINLRPLADTNCTINNWTAFRFYWKNSVFAVNSNDLTGFPPNLLVYFRAINDYTAGANVQIDYDNGLIEIIGGNVFKSIIDPQNINGDAFDMDNMIDGLQQTDPAIRKVTLTEDERTKLRLLEPASFKGVFADPTALRTAHDNSTGLLKDGDSANVTSTTSTWAWDSNLPPTPPTVGGDWYDTGVASGGDMVKSIFSPAKNVVLYNTDNHDTGVVNAVYPIVDRDKLAAIEPGATADQTALEIKTAYESNPDTNVFLDAEKVKLAGIEDAAKDDQIAIEVPYNPTGTNLIATNVQDAINEIVSDNHLYTFTGPATTTLTTFQNVLNATEIFTAGDYEILCSYGWNHNAIGSDFESKITFDSNILFDPFANGVSHKEEPKNLEGNGGSSGTSQQLSFSAATIVTLTAGTKTLLVDYRTDSAGDESTIWDVFISIKKIN